MLTLYRKRQCAACDEVEAQLRELTLACKVVMVDDAAASTSGLAADTELPMLQDDSETYTGSQPIRDHLDRVAQLKDRWQRYGADACYCDDDGEVL